MVIFVSQPSSTIIEQLAVNAVNDLALNLKGRLKSNVKFGDKDISYDGNIEVYHSNQFNKRNLVGIVPVQVKGKTVSTERIKKCKYPVELDDLRIYYREGGVLFFCVLITPNSKTKVFYRFLLPLDIRAILNHASPTKKTKSLKFIPITNYMHLEEVCHTFLGEAKKQAVSMVEHHYKFQEFMDHRLTIPSLALNETSTLMDIKETIIGMPAYFYGVKQGRTYPINSAVVETFTEKSSFKMNFDHTEYEYQFAIEHHKGKGRIIIEDTITIEFKDNSSNSTFHISGPKNIASYKKSLLLLKELMESKELVILNGQLVLTEPQSGFFSGIDEKLYIVEQVEEVFMMLGVPLGYDISTENFTTVSHELIQIFLEGHTHLLKISGNTEELGIIRLKIFRGKKVFLYYNRKDSQHFHNIFNEDVLNKIVVSPTKNSEETNVSFFTTVPPEELLAFINFNVDVVLNSFHPSKHFYNDETFGHTTNYVLKCLTAYDICKNEVLLTLVETILQNYINNIHNEESIRIIKLNLYQTKIRQGKRLDIEEDSELAVMKLGSLRNDDVMMATACSILMGNYTDAQILLEQLDQNDQTQFKSFPIYHLLAAVSM